MGFIKGRQCIAKAKYLNYSLLIGYEKPYIARVVYPKPGTYTKVQN